MALKNKTFGDNLTAFLISFISVFEFKPASKNNYSLTV